jgi:hypothetical protein
MFDNLNTENCEAQIKLKGLKEIDDLKEGGVHIYKVWQCVMCGKENGGILWRLTLSHPTVGAPAKIKTRKTLLY